MKYLDKIYNSQDIISEFGEKKTIDGTSYYTSEFVYYNNFDANKTYPLDVYPFWKDESNNYYKRASTAVPVGCKALVGLINYCYKSKDNGVDAAMTAYDVLKTGTKNTWTRRDGKLVTKTYALQNYQVNGLSIRGSRQNIESHEVLDQDKYGSTDQPPYTRETPPYSSGTSGKTLHWYGKNLSFSDGYLQFLDSIEGGNCGWYGRTRVALPANSKKIVLGLTIPGNYSLSYDQGISINNRWNTGFFADRAFADLRFGNENGFSEHKITGSCNISSNSIKFYELDIPTGATAISFNGVTICFLSSNQATLRTIQYYELTAPVAKYDGLINSKEISPIDYTKTYPFIHGGYVVHSGIIDTHRSSYCIAHAEDGWESGAIVWENAYSNSFDGKEASFKYKITISPQSWLINEPYAPYDIDLLNNVIAFDKPGIGESNKGGVIFEHLLKLKMQRGFSPLQGSFFNLGDNYTNRYLEGENSKGSKIKKYCNCSPEKWYGNNFFNLGGIVGVINGWEDDSEILDPNTSDIVGQSRIVGYGASVYVIAG